MATCAAARYTVATAVICETRDDGATAVVGFPRARVMLMMIMLPSLSRHWHTAAWELPWSVPIELAVEHTPWLLRG